jgi:serine protease Do
MKKVLVWATVLAFTTASNTAKAQDETVIEEKKDKGKEKKETQEIIIRKKGDKDTKITVEINGDKVTVNGKPLSEFKDGDVTINKRNIKIWDGHNNFSFTPNDMEVYLNGPLKGRMGGESRALLGVTTDNEEDDSKKSEGAVITNVNKGSAAEKAGLKEGDIITKINDKKITDFESLTEVVGSYKPKDEVTVYYKRNGKENSTKAILGGTKGLGSMSYSFSGPRGNVRSFTIPRAPRQPYLNQMPNIQMWDDNGDVQHGFDNLSGWEGLFPRQQKLGLKIQDTEEGNGVKVLDTEKDSPAEKAGLKKDDVVTEIGGKKVSNTDEAREQLHDNAEKAAYTIKAKRNGSEMSFDIKFPKKLKTADL